MPQLATALAPALPTSKDAPRVEPRRRVTFAIPEILDRALELYCTGTGKKKNEVAAAAFADYLSHNQKDLQDALLIANAAISELFSTPSPPR